VKPLFDRYSILRHRERRTSDRPATASNAENAKNAERDNGALQVNGNTNVGAVLGFLGAFGVE